jgi:hypothetical protein
MSVKSLAGSALGVVALALCCVGCGPPSPQQRINTELERTGQKLVAVAPLSGRVTIDGQPPSSILKDKSQKLVVMLYDLSKPTAALRQRPHVNADPDGSFRFSSYGIGDGVPPATYVVVFAVLTDKKKHGYVGPDELKNLYNDPEKNEKIPEFKIDHKAPGKTDYEFNLKLAGNESSTPSSKALTSISD